MGENTIFSKDMKHENSEMTAKRISNSNLTDDPGDLRLGHLDRRQSVTVGNVQLGTGFQQELAYLDLALLAAVMQS